MSLATIINLVVPVLVVVVALAVLVGEEVDRFDLC